MGAVGVDPSADLFPSFSSPVGSPVLTLPSFSLPVGDEEYQIWEEHEYHLSDIETQVPVLMPAVRVVSTSLVWLAFVRYLQHVYSNIFGGD